MRYAGRLSQFYTQWSSITNDQTILSWISGYRIPFSRPVIQSNIPKSQSYTKLEKSQLKHCISDLLTIGAISQCKPCNGQFLSSFFLVPKPNGKNRFILNLKNLNKFIDTEHFKLEDLRTAIKLVSPKFFMCTVDLKDAYFLIKIHKKYKKYLRFQFGDNNEIFEFNVLPFGLSTAPFVFTKVMKPVVKLLRSSGYISTLYLDDFLLINNDYVGCLDNLQTTVKLLQSLGFIINYDKSNFQPSKCCKFLGYIIDTENFHVTLPPEKIEKIKNLLCYFKKLKRCKIRDFARLIGSLTSACPAVEYGWLYTKSFERCKYLNLKNDPDNYERYMNIPNNLKLDFEWWSRAINSPTNSIKYDEYVLEIFSDASTTGWGAACGEETASGIWTDIEHSKHINYLEILAAYFGLKIFAKELHNCQILLRIDNTTAISYVNRMGGVQFPHLTQITRDLWQWCEKKHIIVFASYIRSAENVIADAESRRHHPDVEWELADYAFKKIVEQFGRPEIDLFASRVNKKCDKYVSWNRDPDAFAINAFTIQWSNYYFYAFPPFTMILKSLRKIVKEKAVGIVVVPWWPTQPWFPLYKRLLVSTPLYFEPSRDLILSHSSNRLVHQRLTLAAGVLSGRLC